MHSSILLLYLFRKYQITKAQHISGGYLQLPGSLLPVSSCHVAGGMWHVAGGEAKHNYNLWRAISII